ncbi:hypothetical protein GCM10010451_14040 [Streptomyces virens]|jgi:hypothetical protein|uniref:MmpS family membrane protein n=1 Tax=Streptomyces virens TaxID=285572 RepID=A0ABP6P4H1_9ACTN
MAETTEEEARTSGSVSPESTEGAGKDSADPAGGTTEKGGRGDRAGFIVACAVLVVCLGLVLYGVLGTEDGTGDDEPKVPTAAVTYEVTGEGSVDVSYLGRSEKGTATVEKNVELPWKKTVQVPLGRPPTVGIVLDAEGGQARCALAIRGKHVQSSTASGSYGRATCAGELPAPPSTDPPADNG